MNPFNFDQNAYSSTQKPIEPANENAETMESVIDNANGEDFIKQRAERIERLPTREEAVKQVNYALTTIEDFSDVMNNSEVDIDKLSEYTKMIPFKYDDIASGTSKVGQLKKYPGFFELFPGKESFTDISILDVRKRFAPQATQESLDTQQDEINLSEAAAEIMEKMNADNRFSPFAKFTQEDYEIMARHHVKNPESYKTLAEIVPVFNELAGTPDDNDNADGENPFENPATFIWGGIGAHTADDRSIVLDDGEAFKPTDRMKFAANNVKITDQTEFPPKPKTLDAMPELIKKRVCELLTMMKNKDFYGHNGIEFSMSAHSVGIEDIVGNGHSCKITIKDAAIDKNNPWGGQQVFIQWYDLSSLMNCTTIADTPDYLSDCTTVDERLDQLIKHLS